MRITLLAFCICTSVLAISQTLTTYTTADGMASDNCRDVSCDINGNVWVATQGGVSMWDGSVFTNHSTSTHPGMADNSVNAIEAISNGEVWIGTDFGLSVFDGNAYTTYTTADGLGSDQIQRIVEAPSGDVWVGTLNGASIFSGGVFTSYGAPDIPFGGVYDIDFDTNGDVWLGGGLSGVTIFDGTNFTQIGTSDGLISGRTTSLMIDGAQNRWVGTDEGITALDPLNNVITQHTTLFQLPPPDTLNPVTDVEVALNGVVWAAVYVDYLVTVGGVSYYDGIGWNQLESSDGLAGPNVRRVDTDGFSHAWVTTSTGLTQIGGVAIGVEETSKRAIEFYPNPANENITVNAIGNSSLSIHSMSGALLHTQQLKTGSNTIDVSHLQSGIYLMRNSEGLIATLSVH